MIAVEQIHLGPCIIPSHPTTSYRVKMTVKSSIYTEWVTFLQVVQILRQEHQNNNRDKQNQQNKKDENNEPKGIKIYKIHGAHRRFESRNKIDAECKKMRIK